MQNSSSCFCCFSRNLSRLSGEVKTVLLIWRRPRFDFLAAGVAACRGLSVVRMKERLDLRDVEADDSMDSIENHFVNVLRHQKLMQQCYCPD